MEEIVDLEKQGWKALSSSQESAKNFYGDVLMDGAVMIFSGGMRLQGKEKILASFSSQPWDDYHLEDIEHKTFSNEVALLTYSVSARREEGETYQALIGSLYILRKGQWKLAFHQQSTL